MVKMNLGLLLVLLWACSAIRAHRPRYGGSRRKAATQPQWFQMYSTGYKQCMTLRYVTYVRLSFRGLRRVTTPKLFTSRCVRNSPNQLWGWTRNGQLQIKSNKRCLTLVPGRRYRSPTVTVQPCRGITTQQWTCNGHWLKSKSRNSYLVPIKYHGNRNGAVVIRSQATTSCKWVRYDSRRPLCKETAAPQPRWFQMYSTAYKQCMTLRYVTYIRFSRKGTRRFSRPTLKTYPCIRDNSKQLWQWTSSGELKVKYNKRCLTLVTGKRFRSPTLTMQPCQKKYTQQWTCNGNWLKSKSSNNYLVPVRYYKNRYGAVVVRSRVTTSSKWVRRNSWRTLCDSGISTTLTPKTTSTTTQKTPLVRKSTTQPKTTAQTPPLPSTASPTPPAPITPPVPPTDSFLTPPEPTFPGVTPPVPPTIKTTKPPPPPGNKNVKCGTKGRVGGVVNGTKSAAGSWPWQVGIRSCPDCNITCGGTLIKDDWVATAAHCVSDWFPHELYLVAGEIDQAVGSGHEQEFRCDKIIVHEQYGHDAPYDKDIALVRLSKYAVFNDHVRPLCLPDTDSVLTDQDLCTVTGFGRVEQSGLKSARLLQANVKVVDQETCKKAYASLDPPRPVTKNMFCAGFEQGGTDACQGDSGGPLTCFDRRNAKFMLGGVVSWGVGCAQAKQYGVYTNVALFTSWIKEEIAKY